MALTFGVGLLVVVARRISIGVVVSLTLLALLASNSSLTGLKSNFLVARWGALAAAALVLLPELIRADATVRRRLLPLAFLPALGVLSAIWSVDPRLTVERSATFGVLVIAAGSVACAIHRDE